MVETREQRRVRGEMEHFVRHLTTRIPLSTLTLEIARDLFQIIVFKKKQLTGSQFQTLQEVFNEISRAEKNKEFKDSEFKVFFSSNLFIKLIYFRPAGEEIFSRVSKN